MRPSYGTSFSTARRSVVFPEPLSPIKAVMRPRAMPALRPVKMRVPPSSTDRLCRFSKSTAVSHPVYVYSSVRLIPRAPGIPFGQDAAETTESFHRLSQVADGLPHALKVVIGVEVGRITAQAGGVGGLQRVHLGEANVDAVLVEGTLQGLSRALGVLRLGRDDDAPGFLAASIDE